MSIREDAVRLYVEGCTVREVETVPGMPSRQTVYRWVTEDAPESLRSKGRRPGMAKESPRRRVGGEGDAYDGFEGTLEEKVRKLELENDILRGMVEVLKGAGLGQLTNREKSTLIEWLRRNASHPLKDLTASLRISKSSYEHWRVHLGDADIRDEAADAVGRIFREDGDCARGYRFVHEVLVRELKRPISEKVVRVCLVKNYFH